MIWKIIDDFRVELIFFFESKFYFRFYLHLLWLNMLVQEVLDYLRKKK